MPIQAPTWLHASGYRYLVRRLECALLGKDLRSARAGLRTPISSLACGGALALVAVLGCAALALLRPQVGLGDARIVMGKASGALYVRVGDTWHPVLNLASARLILTADANPIPVPESTLARAKHGALLGIPGAPSFFGPPLPAGESTWTICDDDGEAGTTMLVGPAPEPSLHPVQPDRAVVAVPPAGSPAYLLYRGRRAVLDLADPAVPRALGLSGQVPRVVSQSLLNAIPEAPPIATPRIRGVGGPAAPGLPGFVTGSVLRITRAAGDEYYVVLAGGVQRISHFTADLLRFGDSQGAATAIAVAPDLIRAVPLLDTLAVAGFPDEAPMPVSGETTVCATWAAAPSGRADIALLTGARSAPSVTLAQADGRGPALDAVRLPPGRSAYVVATGLTGTGAAVGTRYLVTDAGVRFPIPDDVSARALGLPAVAPPAPWPMLAALPGGPQLSREKASVVRDTIGADSP